MTSFSSKCKSVTRSNNPSSEPYAALINLAMTSDLLDSLRACFVLTYLVFITAIAHSTACHNFHQLQQARSSHVSRVSLASTMPALPTQQLTDKCYFVSLPYNAGEILEATTIYPMSDSLTISAGGRITCGFDDDREYCSWHNALDANLKFSKAEWNSLFDQNRFDCSNQRPFYPRNTFLLVKGGPDGINGKAVLETTIPCQYDSALIKFDVWSLTDTPVLRFCVSWLNNTGHCENAFDVPNPINITIPHSVEPITVRIEILNMNSPDIVLIDNLYYEGQLCEVVDEKEQNFVTDESATKLASSIQPHLSINKITRDADTNEPATDHAIQDRVGMELTIDGEAKANAVKVDSVTFEDDPDVVACEGLTCDFNHNHSCFYKLSGFGSTSPWLIGTSFVGNRHTGVQRLNQDDSNRVGFAYVGRDHVDESNEIFVMESPKITISTDANFLFDVYFRSYSPRFKVCVDSFDNCLYESPRVSKNAFWIRDNSIVLQKGVRKIYLIATNVRQNQFLAVDRLRLQLSGKPCVVRRL